MTKIYYVLLFIINLGCDQSLDANKKPPLVDSIDSIAKNIDRLSGVVGEEYSGTRPVSIREPYSVVKCLSDKDAVVHKVVYGIQDTLYHAVHFYLKNDRIVKAVYFVERENKIANVGSQYYNRDELIYSESKETLISSKATLKLADSVYLVCIERMQERVK